MKQKKAILVNDLSGFGRCSLSVELPILSVLQLECLLLPSAVLSAHTAYPGFILHDLSEDLNPFMDHWHDLQIEPDAILCGYLADKRQVESVLRLMELFASSSPMIAVDPVMADDGKFYPGFDQEHLKLVRKLLHHARLITPNVTEACLLCDREYGSLTSSRQIEEMAFRLQEEFSCDVVISGWIENETISDCILENGKLSWVHARIQHSPRPGTGDVFFSVLCGLMLHGVSLAQSVKTAGDFVRICLDEAEKLQVPKEEGVPFEKKLDWLLETFKKMKRD